MKYRNKRAYLFTNTRSRSTKPNASGQFLVPVDHKRGRGVEKGAQGLRGILPGARPRLEPPRSARPHLSRAALVDNEGGMTHSQPRMAAAVRCNAADRRSGKPGSRTGGRSAPSRSSLGYIAPRMSILRHAPVEGSHQTGKAVVPNQPVYFVLFEHSIHSAPKASGTARMPAGRLLRFLSRDRDAPPPTPASSK